VGLCARDAVMVMMLPPVFCASICLMASCVTYRKPSRLVETRGFQILGRIFSKRFEEEDAALFDQRVDRLETGERRVDDPGRRRRITDVAVDDGSRDRTV